MSVFDAFMPRERQISRFATSLRNSLDANISLDPGRQVEVQGKATPVLRNGSADLNLDCSIPDGFTAQTGVTATIFVKSADDFIRISTSIKKQNGERAIGTALNRAHPGYSRLLAGQSYVGYATLFGTQYLTQYDAINDARGKVIGALYVGIDVSKHRQLSMAAKLSLLTFVLTGVLFWAVIQAGNASLGFGLGAAAIVAGVLYQMLNLTITKPLQDARDATKRLAAGDLTAQLHVDRADEIGELMQAINGVSQGLSDIVGNVRNGSNHITSASREIATGNADLSSRTSSQAAALEETAASMEELTAGVRQNSENAQHANQLVLAASAHAVKGGEVISQVVTTMGAIKQSSQQVTQFVNEIEDIAFQTNILALNAAVEAARAGAQGRSFTVVAGDVRSLAQRCDVAAKQIKALTSESATQVDAGTALTDLTTRARIGADRIVVTGQKRWCSGGGHADAYVVYCRLSDAPGAAGIGAVLVEKDTPGLSFGRPEKLMGFRGIPSSDIFMDEVSVPLDNLIVPAGGFRKLMEAFDLERCGNATMSLGIAGAALEEALAYVQERRQFGRPIVEFQAVQLKLADMAIRVEAARLLIWRAAQNAASGLPSLADSSIAKCFANEMVREVAAMGMQVMGGYGYSTEYKMEQRLRDAFGWGIAGGAIDVQKTNIAAALVGRRFNQRA